MQFIPITSVTVKDRARTLDEGHIKELSESIRNEGLLQPIVVYGDDNRLVAGEHRLASYFKLFEESGDPMYEQIAHISLLQFLIEQGKVKEGAALTEGDLIRYEIEENVKRLGMGWQDRVRSMARYHKISLHEASSKGEEWRQAQTGSLLNMSQAHVSRALVVAKRLSNPEDVLWTAESLSQALKMLLKERQDEVAKHQLERMRDRRKSVERTAPAALEALSDSKPVFEFDTDTPVDTYPEGSDSLVNYAEDARAELYSKADLLSLYYQGDALELLPKIAAVRKIHHIITDPPYGIEMDNLSMKNLGDIIETHQVEPNVALLLRLLEVSYEVIEEKGFMCMWYDLDHHNLLQEHAAKVGWKVCRWPFIWAKSSSCSNQAAAYNFTKSTEACMILRRSGDAVLSKKQSSNFIVAPSSNSTGHPFHKPFSVWERLIEAVSYEGQTIVDPFAGSGSMLNTGLKLNRDVVGGELDEKHIHSGVSFLHSSLNAPAEFMTPLM